jgi:hypothetical protein
MITILFDHQYKFLGNNLKTFFEMLISGLEEDSDFNVIVSSNKDESIVLLRNQEFDIFQPTGLDNYFIDGISATKQLFIIIPDMINELFFNKADKDFYEIIDTLIKNKTEQIMLCDRVIFTSELTEKSFWRFFNTYKENLFETKFNKINYWGDNLQEGTSLDFKYILYSDDRRYPIPYKMFYEFLINIGETLLRNPDIKLVLSGYDLSDQEKEIINDLNIAKSIVCVKKTKMLYKNALCCIFPSSFDGLNTSFFEALNNDCLVLLNFNNPYFKEVVGNKDLLFYDDEIFDIILDDIIHNVTIEEKKEIIKNQRSLKPTESFIEQYKTICKKTCS